MTSYSDVSLMIDGAWTKGANGRTIPVINPATEEVIGQVAHAEKADLDRALEAAERGFQEWRKVSPFDRYKIMRKAAELIRQRVDEIAPIMTLEQGKPVIEPRARPCWPPTSSSGWPRKAAAPTAASFRPACPTSTSS